MNEEELINDEEPTGDCTSWLRWLFCYQINSRADTVYKNISLDTQIEVDLSTLSSTKRNQIRRIRNLIQTNRAYSLHYYDRARFWKRIYWGSNLLGIILTSGNTIINVFYDPCSDSRAVQNYNILFGALITSCLGAFTFLNASLRRRQYEEAGDEYKILAYDLHRKTFFSNKDFTERDDLDDLLDEYSIRFEAYSKIYEEPRSTQILKILGEPRFDLKITFVK